MRGKFLLTFRESGEEYNIYADRSSLVLEWLLINGTEELSIRQVSRATGVSIGLVQRIFSLLILKGYLKSKGLRTAKKFIFKNPKPLLKSWLDAYSIVKKCKMSTYRTPFQD